MRTKLLLATAATAAATSLAPMPNASAFCDARFLQATGHCSVCLLVASHSQRPQPIICPV